MQIVIEIDEYLYKTIKSLGIVVEDGDAVAVSEAIMNGIPLPKGHGDLFDRNEVIKSLFDYFHGKKTIGQCIDSVYAIIEADTERSDEE